VACNDDAASLSALSERLMACGVLPYYLHLLDASPARRISRSCRASRVELVQHWRHRCRATLVPRLVREERRRSVETARRVHRTYSRRVRRKVHEWLWK
jgi:L-lysine 2,3-aminomutase